VAARGFDLTQAPLRCQLQLRFTIARLLHGTGEPVGERLGRQWMALFSPVTITVFDGSTLPPEPRWHQRHQFATLEPVQRWRRRPSGVSRVAWVLSLIERFTPGGTA